MPIGLLIFFSIIFVVQRRTCRATKVGRKFVKKEIQARRNGGGFFLLFVQLCAIFAITMGLVTLGEGHERLVWWFCPSLDHLKKRGGEHHHYALHLYNFCTEA